MSRPDIKMLDVLDRINWPSLTVKQVMDNICISLETIKAAEKRGAPMELSRARIAELRVHLIPQE